jgi:hypothetical protein
MNAAILAGREDIRLLTADIMRGTTKLSLRPRRPDFGKSPRAPRISKVLDRRRCMPRVVIVCVRVDQHGALHDLVAIVDLTREFHRAIDDGLASRRCLFFDALAVAKPSDVGPVGGDWIEPEFGWTRHPHAILKYQRHSVITQ